MTGGFFHVWFAAFAPFASSRETCFHLCVSGSFQGSTRVSRVPFGVSFRGARASRPHFSASRRKAWNGKEIRLKSCHAVLRSFAPWRVRSQPFPRPGACAWHPHQQSTLHGSRLPAPRAPRGRENAYAFGHDPCLIQNCKASLQIPVMKALTFSRMPAKSGFASWRYSC